MREVRSVMQNSKHAFPVKRLATDAVLIAVYFALAVLSIEVYGVKITFNSLPVVIAAMIFGPLDGFLVPFLGEFLSQIIHYGFTPTTILWMLAPAVRGLIVGAAVLLLRKSMSVDVLIGGKRPWVYFLVCIVAAVITSLGNTGAYYVDSKMLGYYNYALIFGVAGIRIISNVVSSILTAILAIPVLAALRKAKLIKVHAPAPANS